MKVAEKIEKKIKRMSEGTTFKYQQLGIVATEYSAAAKAIERLIEKGVIKRITTGVFYKPKKSIFGELRPREREIIKPYLYEQGKRIAYITGTALYNNMGLTTQVPKTVKIASRSKRIYIDSGSIKAKPVKSYVDVTEDNYSLLEILDVLKDFTKIPDMDKKSGIRFLQDKLGNLSEKETNTLVKYALKYPPRVRAFLGAILNEISGQENSNLKQSLNPLTTYSLNLNENILTTAPNWNIK
jgi:predicted transcriptional regulator of viral defense system